MLSDFGYFLIGVLALVLLPWILIASLLIFLELLGYATRTPVIDRKRLETWRELARICRGEPKSLKVDSSEYEKLRKILEIEVVPAMSGLLIASTRDPVIQIKRGITSRWHRGLLHLPLLGRLYRGLCKRHLEVDWPTLLSRIQQKQKT